MYVHCPSVDNLKFKFVEGSGKVQGVKLTKTLRWSPVAWTRWPWRECWWWRTRWPPSGRGWWSSPWPGTCSSSRRYAEDSRGSRFELLSSRFLLVRDMFVGSNNRDSTHQVVFLIHFPFSCALNPLCGFFELNQNVRVKGQHENLEFLIFIGVILSD